MKLILDTNIWYEFETNSVFSDKSLEKNIYVTYLNYFEIFKSKKIISNPEFFRKMFIEMDKYQKIFEPPFVYVAKLHKFYHFNVLTELKDQIEFIIRFKNGDYIDPAKEEEFKDYVNHINENFNKLADDFNKDAKIIKSKIKNLNKHRAKNSINNTTNFISFLVNHATKQEITNFDIIKNDLLTSALDTFLKKIEVGELVMKTNDINDFLMLSYVQPGDKYYTKEQKWEKLIIESGKSDYLF